MLASPPKICTHISINLLIQLNLRCLSSFDNVLPPATFPAMKQGWCYATGLREARLGSGSGSITEGTEEVRELGTIRPEGVTSRCWYWMM